MANPWLLEFWRFAGLVFVAILVGLVAGHITFALLIAVSIYLLYHLTNLRRLERWFQGKDRTTRELQGVWGEIYYHLQRLQRRNRKRKKKLAAMLNRFRESTAAMPDATVVLDQDGLIEWWNEASGRVFGLRQAQDVGQPFTNLVRHPDLLQYLERQDYTEAVGLPSPVDDRIRLSVRVIPYGNNQRLVVGRDMTRLFLLEQMRRDFIANVSHELRTPLTVISGYVEALQDADEDCTRQWGRSLTSMQQQAARMQQIVTDLLLLSRLETEDGQRERHEVDVPGMLTMMREEAELLGRGRHELHVEADPGLWLLGSRSELRSALSNLVFNAVRYTPEGGRIDIRWFSDDEGAHFQVQDTGIGIAAQHLPRLTERFYRVDVGRSREVGGTGLGLAIVKHVLMRHQATLSVDSAPGEGSTFACHFPPDMVFRSPEARANASD